MDTLPEWAVPLGVALVAVDRILAWVDKLRQNKRESSDRENTRGYAKMVACEAGRHDTALARLGDSLERVVVLLDKLSEKFDEQALRSERLHAETQVNITREVTHTRHSLADPINVALGKMQKQRSQTG